MIIRIQEFIACSLLAVVMSRDSAKYRSTEDEGIAHYVTTMDEHLGGRYYYGGQYSGKHRLTRHTAGLTLNPLSPHDAIKHHFTDRKKNPTTKGFSLTISMKLFYQYMAIFFIF